MGLTSLIRSHLSVEGGHSFMSMSSFFYQVASLDYSRIQLTLWTRLVVNVTKKAEGTLMFLGDPPLVESPLGLGLFVPCVCVSRNLT